MQNYFRKYGLQLFGEGASAGGDGGSASTGVGAEGAAADAGQVDVLEQMGVPRKEVERYRAKKGYATPAAADAETEPGMQAQPAEAEPQAAQRQSLKDALKDNQDWNKEMQAMMSERVKKTNVTLSKAMQILSLVGQDYGMDVEDLGKLDLDALQQKVENDEERASIKRKAAELGLDRKTAQQMASQERQIKQYQAEQAARDNDAMLQQHYRNLQEQAAELAKEIPGFDLDQALQEQAIYERTLPGSRMTLKEAYYSVHGAEIAKAQASAAVRSANQAISNSIQAGRRMPQENGTVRRAATQAPPVLYSRMSPEQKKEFERRIKSGQRF